MIQFHIAKGCAPTAKILSDLVAKERIALGLQPGKTGHVAWGFHPGAQPALNANCGAHNKLTELQTLAKAGVTTVPFFAHIPSPRPFGLFPPHLLARKLRHHGGRDIILCKGPVGVRKALQRGRSFFTSFIPSKTEYRVWIYRGRHLGTYEKILERPNEQHRMVGRNYKNGYAFHLVAEASIPRAAVALAVKAVAALGLDFGGVDILLANTGAYLVLEVNTAPGVEGPGRQVIKALAHRIVRWEQAGFPDRKADA